MLTWQRLERLPESLEMLSKQTNNNFSLYISNSNLEEISRVEELVTPFKQNLSINLTHDSNELYSFRRLFIGKDLAEKGFEVILFLDDDVIIPENYVDQLLNHFEPNSYKSAYAWKFLENGKNYYRNRVRIDNANSKVHYCGTAVSIIDAKIFLENGLFAVDSEVHKIEDLWMSYYADHVLGWKLEYIHINNLSIGGNDSVALSKLVKRDRTNKAVLLRKLVGTGWKI
jgi:hypothetical protein